MKFLILFILSFNLLANGYVKYSEVKECTESGKKIKSVHQSAQKCGADCFSIPGDMNCSYHELKKLMVNDYEKPLFGRREEVESCQDIQACESLRLTKKCSLEQHYPSIDLDQLRAFCIKEEGFEQKLSEVESIVVNEEKKSVHDSTIAIDQAKKKALKDAIADIEKGKEIFAFIQLSNKQKGLSSQQRQAIRSENKDIKEDLLEGYLVEAKVKIEALPASGIITESDKVAVVKMIDDYLSAKKI